MKNHSLSFSLRPLALPTVHILPEKITALLRCLEFWNPTAPSSGSSLSECCRMPLFTKCAIVHPFYYWSSLHSCNCRWTVVLQGSIQILGNTSASSGAPLMETRIPRRVPVSKHSRSKLPTSEGTTSPSVFPIS